MAAEDRGKLGISGILEWAEHSPFTESNSEIFGALKSQPSLSYWIYFLLWLCPSFWSQSDFINGWLSKRKQDTKGPFIHHFKPKSPNSFYTFLLRMFSSFSLWSRNKKHKADHLHSVCRLNCSQRPIFMWAIIDNDIFRVANSGFGNPWRFRGRVWGGGSLVRGRGSLVRWC